MVCVYCGNKTQVVNSRLLRSLNRTWRRRQCTTCREIFTTVEQADGRRSFMVSENESTLQPFSRDKLFASLYEACGHRQNAVDDASALSDTVIAHLMKEKDAGSLFTKQAIRAAALQVLTRFDQAAATYYQAYHAE